MAGTGGKGEQEKHTTSMEGAWSPGVNSAINYINSYWNFNVLLGHPLCILSLHHTTVCHCYLGWY